MSTFNGGPQGIVTNGLVLYLDAANRDSYVSGSTTWNDLSRNRINGTLVNGVGFSGANAGSMTFDNVDDFVNLGNTIQAPTNFTITTWLSNPNSRQGGILTKGLVNEVTEWGLSFGYSNPRLLVGRPRGFNQQVSASWVPYTTGFHHIAYTVSGSNSSSLYINNVLVSSNALTVSPGTTTENLQVGLHGTLYYFGGNISNIQLYNRVLTTQEILQNYNSTKARYGL